MTNRNDVLAALAAEIRASLGNGTTASTRRRWAIEIEALAAPAEGGQGEAVKWECRTVDKKTGSVHYDWRACSQAEFDGGSTEGSTLRVEYRALYTTPPAASVVAVEIPGIWIARVKQLERAFDNIYHMDEAAGGRVTPQEALRLAQREAYLAYSATVELRKLMATHKGIHCDACEGVGHATPQPDGGERWWNE